MGKICFDSFKNYFDISPANIRNPDMRKEIPITDSCLHLAFQEIPYFADVFGSTHVSPYIEHLGKVFGF